MKLSGQIDRDAEVEGLRQLAAGVIARAVNDLLITRQATRLDGLFFCLSDQFVWWAEIAGYCEEEIPMMRAKLIQRWKDGLAKLS